MTSHNRTEPVTRCSTVSRLAASSVSRRGGDCSIMVISYSLSYNRRSINERFRFPFSLRLRNMIVWRHSLSSCIGWNWKWSSESSISSLYCLHSLALQYLTNDLQRVSDLDARRRLRSASRLLAPSLFRRRVCSPSATVPFLSLPHGRGTVYRTLSRRHRRCPRSTSQECTCRSYRSYNWVASLHLTTPCIYFVYATRASFRFFLNLC